MHFIPDPTMGRSAITQAPSNEVLVMQGFMFSLAGFHVFPSYAFWRFFDLHMQYVRDEIQEIISQKYHLPLSSSPDRAPVQPRAGSGHPGAAAGSCVPQTWSDDQKPRARARMYGLLSRQATRQRCMRLGISGAPNSHLLGLFFQTRMEGFPSQLARYFR